jgi:serine/threonine protein kinase/Flp pilus assembly protein TadD
MSASNVNGDSFYAEINDACERFEAEWRSGGQPRIKQYVAEASEEARSELIGELLKLDIYYRRDRGDTIVASDYESYPEHATLVEELLGPCVHPELTTEPRHAGRYRLEKLIGHGGMGEVYRAHDPDFQRPLAVKILKEEYKDSCDLTARFLEEARITGQLQHPGIPPVHEIGRLHDGRPFLAMKLIEGRTLGELLAERKRVEPGGLSPRSVLTPGSNTPGSPSDLPRFLTIFEHVCQTVAYAHSRRVIHRDLKPANVMVGAFGEVQVMDWGLAKELTNQARIHPPPDNADRTTPSPVELETVVAKTQLGQPMGTWAYMPPEQALGEMDKVDERSDVFSLGATLCEILTGEPAYRGPTGEKLRQQAKTADLADAFTRLDGWDGEEELRALAKKCLFAEMDLRPHDAGAVSDAVTAYEAEVQERLRKMELERASAEARAQEARQTVAAERRARRRTVGLAAALVLALLASATAAFVYADAAQTERGLRQTAQEMEEEAIDEKGKAEEAQQQAMDALRGTTDEVVEKLIGAKPALGPLEKEFLESALKRWQTFAAQKGEGALARWVRAVGVFRVAYLWAKLGQNEEARAGFQEAIDGLAQLAADFPAVPEYRQELARSHNNLGRLLADLGRRAAAEAAYRQALDIKKKLAADFPAVPEYRQDLAKSHNNLGILLSDLGKHAAAEAAYRQALDIQEKLAADFPAVPKYRQELAGSHSNLGGLLAELGKGWEAEPTYRRALAIFDKLAADFPAVPEYRQGLARSHTNLGGLLAELGKGWEAEPAYRQALDIQEKLAADFPAVPEYRRELAVSHFNLGNLLKGPGKHAEAEAAYRQALDIQKKLAADFLAVPEYRQDLAKSHNNLGNLLARLGKRAEAEAAYRRALDIFDKLVADFPTVPQYRKDLATSHNCLGTLLTDLGKRAEAEAAYRQALDIFDKLATDFPAVPQYRQELASSYNSLGIRLKDMGKRPKAKAAYRQALDIREKLAADFPAVPKYRQELAGSHNNLGLLLRELGKRAEAEAAQRQAVDIQKKLAAEFPDVPQYRQDLARSHNNLGLLLRELSKRAEAEAAYRQALDIRQKLAGDFPNVPEYRQELARTHNNLGNLLSDLGKRVEAEEAYRQALDIREKLAADFPDVPQYRIDLGGGECNFGNLLHDSNQPEQALPWYTKAIAKLEEVLRQVKVDVTAQRFLRNAHWGRARALDDLKRHAEAATDWDKAIELSPEAERPGLRMHRASSRVRAGQADAAIHEAEDLAKIPHPGILYNAARVFALAADRKDEAGGSLSNEECAKRAIALLRQAVAKGYKDADHMKKDDDLKALRERDDFKKLVEELEKKAAATPEVVPMPKPRDE